MRWRCTLTRRAGQEEDAATYVQRLAREKAETAAARTVGLSVVGADTTVVIDGQILEKPEDADDARRMLYLLNNRWHKVLTGVALVDRKDSETRVAYQETEVKFASMSNDEIEWYVAGGEPMDKAGGYAIQGLARASSKGSGRLLQRCRTAATFALRIAYRFRPAVRVANATSNSKDLINRSANCLARSADGSNPPRVAAT